jgi:DNA polymerase-3 subunit delta
VAARGSTEDSLRTELTKGKFRTAYLLYGEEDLLLEEALHAIIERALEGADRGFNLDVLRGTDADGRDIVARASSFPMMADRRVVVVREVDRLGGRDPELLAAYVEHPSPSTCLVLAGTKPDFRRKPFAAIRKEGGAFEFRPLHEDDAGAWIEARVVRAGRTIAPAAAKLLTSIVGTSLRDLQNEIDKLLIFAADRKELSETDVAAVAGVSREFSIFELQKALGNLQTGRAMMIMERMLESGERVPMIVASLTTFYASLWKLVDCRRRGVPRAEQAAVAQVNPVYFREYGDAIARMTGNECEQAILALSRTDELTKTTRREPGHLMTELVLRLCGEADAGEAGVDGNKSAGAGV